MKRITTWILVVCLVVTSLVLASCSSTSKTSTTMATTTTATVAHWWDALGTPQYGGTMTLRMKTNPTNFDPYNGSGLVTIESGYMERLFTDDWTLNPTVFGYTTMCRPNNYVKGQLAQSWEFTDPTTLVVHIRPNVYWQNIAPANGRELVASDIAYHYNRLQDPTTGAYTKGGPFGATSQLLSLISVTATDKYTVAFKWKTGNPEFIYETVMLAGTSENSIELPEAVQQWGDLSDWHHAIGTGPFMLSDFVDGSSATMVKNPNYWGYDERYPKNKLPYIDTLKLLIIPDDATALAGLRTGQIDDIDGMSYQQAQDMQKTNPKITNIPVPATYGLSVDPRNDVKPFSDIKVREALQMAIDLPTIAKTYYNGTTSSYPCGLTSQYMAGWGLPYPKWPADVQAQYTYNPTAAKQLLADAGYPNGFNTDIVVDTGYDMGLLEIVQSYFKSIGVNMDIKTMDYASWQSFVNQNHKHDQMAALSTGVILGKTIEPIIQLTKFGTTTPSQWTMVNDPIYNDFYTKGIAATSVDQVQQILSDCNLYVAQQHYTVMLLQPMFYALCQPWLKGYNGQQGALSGGSGPTFLFFYPARFWIDPSLK
jgi:peptide/nickel transport system substrate-binding protein